MMRLRCSRCIVFNCLLLSALILSASSARAETAAVVIFVAGDAVAVGANGEIRILAKQSVIEAGDTVDTREGRAQLRFTDGALMSLQPQTQLRVDEYRFTGTADSNERGFFTLIKGGLRTITGAIGRARQSAYQIITNLATIGIRGTEYSIAYGTGGLVGSVGEGGIDVCNGAGCFNAASGESFAVTDANAQPRMREKKTDLAVAQPQSTPAVFAAGESRGPNGALTAVVVPAATQPAAIPVPQRPAALVFLQVELTMMKAFELTTATVDSRGELRALDICDAGCNARWRESVADAHHDDVLAWGRWTGGVSEGHVIDLTRSRSLHYVVGIPGNVDIESLRARNVVAEYSLIGNTTPSAIDGASLGRVTDAKFIAYFTADPYVAFGVRVNMNGVSLTGVGVGSITGGTFSGGSLTRGGINGAIPVALNQYTPNTVVEFSGFFAGPNAERAGLVYELQSNHGPVTGAAALGRGQLAPLQ